MTCFLPHTTVNDLPDSSPVWEIALNVTAARITSEAPNHLSMAR
jgi:hypothetical protein